MRYAPAFPTANTALTAAATSVPATPPGELHALFGKSRWLHVASFTAAAPPLAADCKPSLHGRATRRSSKLCVLCATAGASVAVTVSRAARIVAPGGTAAPTLKLSNARARVFALLDAPACMVARAPKLLADTLS